MTLQSPRPSSPPRAQVEDSVEISGVRRWTLAALVTVAAGVSAVQSLYVPLLPRFQEQFSVSSTATTWVMTSYLLVAVVLTPVVGRVGDVRGRDRVLAVTSAALAIGCALAAVAPGFEVLILARVLQGVAGATLPLVHGLLLETVPPARLRRAVGLVSAAVAGGSALGLVAAGPISATLGTGWVLLLPGVPIALAAALLWRRFPVPHRAQASAGIDVLSAGFLALALIGVVGPLSRVHRTGWTVAETVVPLAAAAGFGVLWARRELRTQDPLVDLRTMRSPSVWSVHAAALFLGAAMFGFFTYLPQFAASHSPSFDTTTAGFLLLPMTVAMFLAGLLAAPLERRTGARTQLVSGCLVAAAGAGWVAGTPMGTPVGAAPLVGAATVFGVGVGLFFPAVTHVLLEQVPPAQAAAASAVNVNARILGNALGVVLVAQVLAVSGPGSASRGAFAVAFALLALLAVGAAVAGAGRHPLRLRQARSRTSRT